MPDATARIKNLSIALEAISRINCEGSADFMDRLSTILEEELKAYKKEQKRREATDIESATDDDEIPF